MPAPVESLHHPTMPHLDLSVVVPAWAGADNLDRLLPSVGTVLSSLGLRWELVVAGSRKTPEVRKVVEGLRVTFVEAPGNGYGEILREGLRRARGRYVVTMDADLSHRAGYVRTIWHHRDRGEVVLASRYVRGSYSEMPWLRRVFSRVLNFIYRKILSLPYRDLSSGFRLFHRKVLDDIGLPQGRGVDVLPEMIVKAYGQGWRIVEVPFWYQGAGAWNRVRMLKLGSGFLRSVGKLFALRNSVKAADYDHRAFDSWIPLQRYWQRRRFSIIQDFSAEAERVLDIGCGSSRIVQTLPHVVGMDLAMRKLRWLRAPGRDLLQGDLGCLPFRDGTFDAVVCSEVIEHVPREQVRLEELARVIRPGGVLVLGTPDYSRRLWRTLEWIYGKVFPGGYVSEHINRYTHAELRALLEGLGLEILDHGYVGRSEMIFKARAPSAVPVTAPQPVG